MSQAAIVNTLIAYNVPQRVIPFIVAQSMHETANFSSNVYNKLNNAFGMKQPKVRSTTSIGESSIVVRSEGLTGYATYKSVADSTKDLLLWLNYNKIDFSSIRTPEDYANFLKSNGYYGDPYSVYINGMKSALKKLASTGFVSSPSAFSIPFLFLLFSSLYLAYKIIN